MIIEIRYQSHFFFAYKLVKMIPNIRETLTLNFYLKVFHFSSDEMKYYFSNSKETTFFFKKKIYIYIITLYTFTIKINNLFCDVF